MFIKEAEQRRKQREQQQEDSNQVQKLKINLHKIGSIKNGKVNYDRDEQFFSLEDVPKTSIEAKQEMQKLTDPDLLGLRKKEWNTSVSIPENPLAEETHERKLIKIKLGLFDQPQPKVKEPKKEEGTDTRNDYKGWNVSTEINLKERKLQNDQITQLSMTKNKEKQAILITEYANPLERQKEFNEMLRLKKQEEKPFRDEIRQNYEFFNPSVSKEKVDAAVFKMTYEAKLRKNQIKQDPTVNFKPDLQLTLKEDKIVKGSHNGNFQIFGFDQDDDGNKIDVGAWSCCMNEDKSSSGCNKYIVDKKKWNLASFNQK